MNVFDLNALSQATAQKFEELLKSAGKVSWTKILSGMPVEAAKAIDTTTGLIGVNLEAPAKLVTPFLAPLNNRIPRVRSVGGTSVQFKRITAYTSSGTSLAVAEKFAAGAASITTDPKVVAYKTYGLRDQVSWESTFAGANFQDPKSLAVMLLVNRVKVEEDKMQIYANAGTGALGYALGTATTPTLVLSATGGAITGTATTGFCSVKVIALTGLGYWASTTTAIAADGRSQVSAVANLVWPSTTTAGTISLSIAPIKGAVAYAWFVEPNGATGGADANKKLEAITTIAEVKLTSIAGTGQALSTVTSSGSDLSANTLQFDGFFAQMAATSSGAYFGTQAIGGTVGSGTPLTHDGGGGITEINAANTSVWNAQNVGPNLILMNAQELNRISAKLLGAGGSYILRVTTDQKPDGNITAGGRVNGLTNKTIGGEQTIIVHPKVAPGHILGVTEQLPYPASNITSVLEMDLLADYTQFDYYPTTTTGPVADFELRCYGALKNYFPASQWSLANIPDAAIT